MEEAVSIVLLGLLGYCIQVFILNSEPLGSLILISI